MSSMPTSGKSARFHMSHYKVVAGHNFRVARNPSRIDAKRSDHCLQADSELLIRTFSAVRC